MIAALLATAAYGLFGQSGTNPAFEAATIKGNVSAQGAVNGRMGVAYKPGGRIIASAAAQEFDRA